MQIKKLIWLSEKRSQAAFLLFAVIATTSAASCAEATNAEVRDALRARIQRLNETKWLDIEGAPIAARHLISAFYLKRDFTPAWTDRKANAIALLDLIGRSRDEGLDPVDYHHGPLRRLLGTWVEGQARSAETRADTDILLTDALIRYQNHLRFGKVNPEQLDPNWNFGPRFDDIDPTGTITAAIEAESLPAFLAGNVPYLRYYRDLKQALERYREIQAKGGWPTIPQGPALEPGVDDARVAVLRKRLGITGDLTTGDLDATQFDRLLEQAVRRFQQRHGLNADGVVGTKTLRAMNVPVEDRIDQIRVNLERARWVAHDIPDTYVVVDIAGFRAQLVRDGSEVWNERVVVGRPYRKTPVFRADMTYLELNPTWTIPPTILKQDVLPKLKTDPDYLTEQNIRVLDHQGQSVDVNTIDWSDFPQAPFPYLLRQDPGPGNALGRIKFMFPNSHLVYLHDTPSKELFGRTRRAFSSGCIRVENPLDLAQLLLNDPERWSRKGIEAAIESGATRTVSLPNPVPVLLLYWTVDIDKDGTVLFRPDVYGRDKKVLEGLKSRFSSPTPAPPTGNDSHLPGTTSLTQ
jgi:murein L,D-transpeptidase YcbB/YkuD